MIVFSEYSLRTYLDLSDAEMASGSVSDGPLGTEIAKLARNDDEYFVHRSDSSTSRLILVAEEAWGEVQSLGRTAFRRLLERVDRVAREIADPPISLPPQWSKYHHDTLLAFFALPLHLNDTALRWIAEALPDGDSCFWRMTSRRDKISLAEFVPSHELLAGVRGGFVDALSAAQQLLPPPAAPGRLQPAIDLAVVGAQSVTRGRPYSGWLPLLTQQQIAVFDYEGRDPLRVRGAAGTGKTLTLQLKALRHVYEADERGEPIRVLYLTHSWGLAEQVDSGIRLMDERGLAVGAIDVMPLGWLRETLHGELPEGVELLGEDSLDGKRLQMSVVSEVMDRIAATDWPTYTNDVSDDLRVAVEAAADDPRRVVFEWDLLREFSEVIDANRLKPGIDSLRKYLDLPREDWMIPLHTPREREFVFAVYRLFVERLVEEGQLTTDQVFDDFRRYLESYTWNLRRQSEGYDRVLVDEFHLFSDTERYIVHLLTKDPNEFPSLVLALDPFQSPFALVTGLPEGVLSRRAGEMIDARSAQAVDLSIVHRFSPEIYAFVRLLYGQFPNLVSLGEDWQYEFAQSTSRQATDAVPRVVFSSDASTTATTALDRAAAINRELGGDDRVAVVALNAADLALLADELESNSAGQRGFTVVRSRDDVELLNYARRTVVVTSAEFAAGLQFSHVVVVALVAAGGHRAGTSAARAALSELYLAATRAQTGLEIYTSGANGSVSDALELALSEGVVSRTP